MLRIILDSGRSISSMVSRPLTDTDLDEMLLKTCDTLNGSLSCLFVAAFTNRCDTRHGLRSWF